MKLIELKCKNCGSNLKINKNEKEITCIYCNTTFKLDDEVQHVKYDNMEQSGYEFEKGRIRAQQEKINNSNNINSNNDIKKKNNKTLWLVLAWIFLLPFTATYFIIKSNKLDKKKKSIIIIVLWIIFIVIGISSNLQEKENLKSKIIECYSENIFNKLDELIGIENINSNNSNSTTCDNLILKNNNYQKIEIKTNNNKQLISIKLGNIYIYENKVKETEKN